MKNPNGSFITIAAFLVFSSGAVAGAGVKEDSPVIAVTSTIQAAVDAANPGDTIFVPPGTYPENVLVNKNDITIIGSRDAVIDAGFRVGIRVGSGQRSVVDGVSLCPPLTVNNFTLKGLTIKNASFAGVFLIG